MTVGPNPAAEAARDLAEAILILREELLKSKMTKNEVSAVLQAFAARPRIEFVKPLEVWSDRDLEEEAEKRNLSWLSLEKDEDLLDEVERRNLTTKKVDLSEEEFEREAVRRGYRTTLAQFPLREIQDYLQIQGQSNHSSHNNRSARRGKKRYKGRQSHSN